MEKLNYRHELKFLCDEKKLFLIEEKTKHICRPDFYVVQGGRYVVRSLYFDTLYNACYHENEMGSDNRKKYRIRIYDGNTDVIKLECKHSVREKKAKEACRISKEQCIALIQGKEQIACDDNQGLLKRFLVERRIYLLQPKVIVEYTRTPYVYTAGNVRITFDRNIQSSLDISNFLNGKLKKRSVLSDQMNLLEVKYDEVFPMGILQVVAAGKDLQRTSFSKYSLCREFNLR